MAIVNGKKLYRGDKLRSLAAEDDQAAAEYAWLMAGSQDDWGRFRLSPRAILGRAYESRPSVTELMVAGWLALYEKHDLLRLYVVDGTTYAEWTNYMGDPPSQRRYHSCPEPLWAPPHKHNKRCMFRDDAVGMQPGRKKGRQPHTQSHTQVDTQPPTLPLSSVPSVPSVPPYRPNGGDVPATDSRGYEHRPSPLVEGRRPDLELEWLRLVRQIAERTGKNPEDVPPAWEGRRGIDPARLSEARLLRDVTDLRARWSALDAAQAEPTAEGDALFDRRAEYVREFREWFAGHPEAGVLDAAPDRSMPGVAFAAWRETLEPSLPLWVADAIRREACADTAGPESAQCHAGEWRGKAAARHQGARSERPVGEDPSGCAVVSQRANAAVGDESP